MILPNCDQCCCHDLQCFFGVYDGHGGRKAADFVAERLHKNIIDMMENCGSGSSKEEAVKGGYLKTDQEFLKQVICGLFLL